VCHMKIQARDVFNNVATAWLEEHFFHRGITVVSVKQVLDASAVHLDHEIELLPDSSVVGVELDDSGKTMATRGIMTQRSSPAF
jgi:hypothetical protein